MRARGIKGVIRGRRVITTNPDTSLPCPDDKVNRLFKAANSRPGRPNKLWGTSINCPTPGTSVW